MTVCLLVMTSLVDNTTTTNNNDNKQLKKGHYLQWVEVPSHI